MAKEPFEQFGMPKEIRAFVEQSVTQAKHAFDGVIQAANQAMGQFEGQAQAARGGANEIAHKSKPNAEQNMAATFEFAEKLMQAKDATEVMRLQSDYLGRQMQALSTRSRSLDKVLPKWWWMVPNLGRDTGPAHPSR